MLDIQLNKKDIDKIFSRLTEMSKRVDRAVYSEKGELRRAGRMYIEVVEVNILSGRGMSNILSRSGKSGAKRKIKTQGGKVAPLTSNYLDWKQKVTSAFGLSIWRLTGSVLKNLTVVRPRGNNNWMMAGLLKNPARTFTQWAYDGVKRKIRGTKGTWYARILEYGYKKIKARPVFGPSFIQVIPKVKVLFMTVLKDIKTIWNGVQ